MNPADLSGPLWRQRVPGGTMTWVQCTIMLMLSSAPGLHAATTDVKQFPALGTLTWPDTLSLLSTPSLVDSVAGTIREHYRPSKSWELHFKLTGAPDVDPVSHLVGYIIDTLVSDNGRWLLLAVGAPNSERVVATVVEQDNWNNFRVISPVKATYNFVTTDRGRWLSYGYFGRIFPECASCDTSTPLIRTQGIRKWWLSAQDRCVDSVVRIGAYGESGDTILNYWPIVGERNIEDPTDPRFLTEFNTIVRELYSSPDAAELSTIVDLLISVLSPLDNAIKIDSAEELDALYKFHHTDEESMNLASVEGELESLTRPGVRGGEFLLELPASTYSAPAMLPSAKLERYDGSWFKVDDDIGHDSTHKAEIVTVFSIKTAALIEFRLAQNLADGTIGNLEIMRVCNLRDQFW